LLQLEEKLPRETCRRWQASFAANSSEASGFSETPGSSETPSHCWLHKRLL
ncbi:hypothetical protein V5799_026979, partial [Amblyomma americanum]